MTKDYMLTSAEVESMLGVTKQRVLALRKSGRLPFIKEGNRYLHAIEDVQRVKRERDEWFATHPNWEK